jgi:hypothetical protein
MPPVVATDRRWFLTACGALAVLSYEGLAHFLVGAPAAEQAVERVLADMFRSPQKARALGKTYLASSPEGADPDTLRARFAAAGSPVTPASFRLYFSNLRRQDFASNRIVVIDGWVLARSEAELCALLSLS